MYVLSQVPQSDLNAAIPFELIPKVTFDFRYDFSHFHMAPAKSLQRPRENRRENRDEKRTACQGEKETGSSPTQASGAILFV